MVEPVTQHHSSSGKFPCEGAIDTIRDLVEAAISNEETISTAAREMREIEHQLGERVRTLPNWVATEVNRRLEETVNKTSTRISARLTDATSAAKRAYAHYENAVKFSIYKIVGIACACFVFGCIGMISGVYIVSTRLILPAPDVLQRVLSTCKTAQGEKPCIRTDERAEPKPIQGGQGETYRLIYGY
jgi:hypothetical protein